MIEDYFFTKNTKWFIGGAAALIVGLLLFHAGVVVGQHEPMRGRMTFNGQGQPTQGGMLGGFMPTRGFVEDGHGAVGTIATVTLPTFTMQNRDGLTQQIYTSTSTIVTGGTVADISALTKGDVVIVIGDPNDTDDGYLDARIIHILPAPPNPSH
jgi:hypothetical protein